MKSKRMRDDIKAKMKSISLKLHEEFGNVLEGLAEKVIEDLDEMVKIYEKEGHKAMGRIRKFGGYQEGLIYEGTSVVRIIGIPLEADCKFVGIQSYVDRNYSTPIRKVLEGLSGRVRKVVEEKLENMGEVVYYGEFNMPKIYVTPRGIYTINRSTYTVNLCKFVGSKEEVLSKLEKRKKNFPLLFR